MFPVKSSLLNESTSIPPLPPELPGCSGMLPAPRSRSCCTVEPSIDASVRWKGFCGIVWAFTDAILPESCLLFRLSTSSWALSSALSDCFSKGSSVGVSESDESSTLEGGGDPECRAGVARRAKELSAGGLGDGGDCGGEVMRTVFFVFRGCGSGCGS